MDKQLRQELKSLRAAVCNLASNSQSNDEILSILQALLDAVLLINNTDFELKALPHLTYCCGEDKYLVINCRKYENGIHIGTETFIWDVQLSTEIATLPPCAELCEKQDECTPWIGGGTADNLTTEGITDLTLIIPKCNCSGVINTSIGTIPFNNITELCLPSMDCPYTLTSIQVDPGSTCSIQDIRWLASRKN